MDNVLINGFDIIDTIAKWTNTSNINENDGMQCLDVKLTKIITGNTQNIAFSLVLSQIAKYLHLLPLSLSFISLFLNYEIRSFIILIVSTLYEVIHQQQQCQNISIIGFVTFFKIFWKKEKGKEHTNINVCSSNNSSNKVAIIVLKKENEKLHIMHNWHKQQHQLQQQQ